MSREHVVDQVLGGLLARDRDLRSRSARSRASTMLRIAIVPPTAKPVDRDAEIVTAARCCLTKRSTRCERRVAVRVDELAGQEAAQLVGELAGVGIAVERALRHRALDDRDEIRGRTALALAQRHDLAERGGRDHVGRGARVVRRYAGERVIEHRAEREHVGALVDRLAARLLGRHVRGRAHDRAGDGQRRRSLHRRARRRLASTASASAARLCGARALSVGVEILREAPVDHDRLAEVAEQHVAGLEIAMDDPLAVRVRDRVARGGEARNDREPVLELASPRAITLSSGRPDTSFIAKNGSPFGHRPAS